MDQDRLKRFNIRVYGLLICDDSVLLAEEFVQGSHITKFPGGGLELGEGPEQCVVREFLEETDLTVEVRSHIYTTGFFQPSAYNPEDQIISIYYQVGLSDSGAPSEDPSHLPEQAPSFNGGILRFRWIPLSTLKPDDVTLPIDRHVVSKCIPALR